MLDANSDYLTALYRDRLHRRPDPVGLADWSAQLERGVSHVAVAEQVGMSDEGRRDIVAGLFADVLQRAPDPQGQRSFTSQLAHGGTRETVLATILASTEYRDRFSDGTALGWLEAVYRDSLGRRVDPFGYASFTAALNAGVARSTIATAIVTSPEARERWLAWLYPTYLYRQPDGQGLANWLDRLQHGVTPERIVAGFLGSAEYRALRFPDVALPEGFEKPDLPEGEVGILGSNDVLVVAPDAGNSPFVSIFDSIGRDARFGFLAYAESFRGGVRVATADVDGDGVVDIITGTGPGGGAYVRVFDGVTGQPMSGVLGGFRAYAPGVTDGVFVAAADVNGDGNADLITGTDRGAAPWVKVFSGYSGSLLASFWAGGLDERGGIHVAAADVTGDGRADVVTGAGPGGPSRVAVYNVHAQAEEYSFFAFDPRNRGGVWVAAGDLDGDGIADIVAGTGASASPELRVFNGQDTSPLGSALAEGEVFNGGVRVALADADGDGVTDIVAGSGAGAGVLRLFHGQRISRLDGFFPFGSSFTSGSFVAGSPPAPVVQGTGGEGSDAGDDVVIQADSVVEFSGSGAVLRESPDATPAVLFSIVRSGDLSAAITVTYSIGGTAESADYGGSSLTGSVSFGSFSSVSFFSVSLINDDLVEGTETLVLTLTAGTGYTIGSTNRMIFRFEDDDGPAPVAAARAVAGDAGQPPSSGLEIAPSGVRYADGTFQLTTTDVLSQGFGTPWGHTRTWSNAGGASGLNGDGGVIADQPYLIEDDDDVITVVMAGTEALLFDLVGGDYEARFFRTETLSYNGTTDEFTLIDTTGNVYKFCDFDTGLPVAQRGSFKSFADPKGNAIAVTSRNGDGKPTEVQRAVTIGGVTTTESLLYAYLTSPNANAGKLASVTLRRRIDAGSWVTTRAAAYSYYPSGDANGTLGDLKRVDISDGTTTLDTYYYRYYVESGGGGGEGESSITSTGSGYAGALKYAFSPASFARADGAVSNPETASEDDIDDYADLFISYDEAHRVSAITVQGQGCSVCTGGLGTYSYAYEASPFAEGYNSWAIKTVETLPDGNENTVYANFAGETMLRVFEDVTTSDTWAYFYKYDSDGRLLWHALPSAVIDYDEAEADLLDNNAGNYTDLRDSSGLIEVQTYGTSTTAGDSTAGNVAGYSYQSKLQRGETGTAILQSTTQYFEHTGGGATVHPVATSTVYRNTDGSGGATTSYAYTWFSSSAQIESQTVTKPTVTTGQNGPNSADTEVTYFDAYARPIWHKDGDGFLTYVAYDPGTGAVTKTIADVQTTQTSDFTALPSGWSTPGGGGLHLITSMEVDGLGRTTKLTDPKGNIDYTVYLDTNHEVRLYPGWQSGTNTPTGPTQVWREDRGSSTGYVEMLTMSATPTTSSNKPTGAESIGSLQTLSRQYISAGGQVTRVDAYFSFASFTYATSLYPGTQNTHFYTTEIGYNKRGQVNRTKLPTGTIERTEYDGLRRAVSQWVGLDDTPTSGSWSPTNTTGTDLVKVLEYEYDAGGVGDSNLTKVTQIPGGGAANRVTQFWFDWRNRGVVTKQGVEVSESTDLNRQIGYVEYNNWNQVVAQEQYDGDNVTIADSNSDGVPDKPSSSLLRARSTNSFDEQGRVYVSNTFSVNQSNGTVSSDSLATNTWYNRRGFTIKVSAPGGLVTKAQIDGAARPTKTFQTDGGGDSAWTDADDVTGDKVLSQVENQYDANGNMILTIAKDRFHDETGTGELDSPGTAPKARRSYVAMYYDAANRSTATVDVGTNGGSAYTRPSTVPSRPDTVLLVENAYNAAGWLETVTDPRGIVGKTYYDALKRVTKTIEAYVDGTPSNADDKTTEYTYDGSGHMLTLKASLTGGAYQKTEWVYGVTTGTSSNLNSNDLLAAIKWPDKSSGDPSSSEKETITVNALGERKTFADRNGSVHTYSYDVVGRTTTDAVTTLGSGVDGSVRRLTTAYDTAGREYLFTSYDASSGGNIVNQVQQAFNGLGQLITEYQSHSGAVNTGTTPKVQYAYSEMASSANHSRPTSMTYPNGRVVNSNYDRGLDTSISRLSSLSDTSATLEAYVYLGLGTVVKRAHAQSGIDLTYIKQGAEGTGDAGDQYTGRDRFGRIVDQRWLVASTSTATDRFKYAYDRDGNRLLRTNELSHALDELYHANGASNGYDSLNQLTDFRRGTLTDANSDGVLDTVTTATRTQGWAFDPLGNWTTLTTDGTGVNRTHNKQNQVTVVGSANLTFDANGNTTTDETGTQFVFDPWNRLVVVKNSGGTTLVTYTFDALKRRVTETASGTTRDLYFSTAWQVLEERVSTQVQVQYVWSPVYVDAMIERDRDADANGGNGLEERLYVQHDANWNVTGLVNTSGTVVERYTYDPYGAVSYFDASWGTRSGSGYGWVYQHQGGRFDTTTNLYLFRHRDDSPTLGRWIQRDPLGYASGEANLYRGNGNATINIIDPHGLGWSWSGCFGGAVSGGTTGAITGAIIGAPAAGVGAGVGAITGGLTGAVAGCLAAGFGVGSSSALSNADPITQFSGGLIIGAPVGIVGGVVGPGVWGMIAGVGPSTVATVSQWGGSGGLATNSWVQWGAPSWLGYLLSGKIQPLWMPGGNIPAPFSSGVAFNVPFGSLAWPSGIEIVKGLLGQRIYTGPPI